MRFPDSGLRCVAYIGEIDAKGFHLRGTGFLCYAFRVDGAAVEPIYYFVTAHHVIRRMKNPNKFAIRINHRDGNSRQLYSQGGFQWWRHPTDKSVDAAIYPWGLGAQDYPYTLFPAERFLTPELISKKMIGVGDETFMVGLFRKWAGHKRITPMVRTGHVAMLASERMPTTNYGDAYMHLIDSFSIKGFSGSPVFVDETVSLPTYSPDKDDAPWLCGTGNTFLLGLVHGIMPVRVIEELHDTIDPDQKWHTGVTQVVPASQILEILNQPKLLDYEKKMKKKLEEVEAVETAIGDDDAGTQTTRAPKAKDRIKIPIPTRGQFEGDLAKATRKRDKK